MKRPARTTARTEDRPVLNDAQRMLTKENPLFDWSRLTSLDSWEMLLSMARLESSAISIAWKGVVEVAYLARYSLTICSL